MNIFAVKEMSGWQKLVLTLNYTWIQLVLFMILVAVSPEQHIDYAGKEALHGILDQAGAAKLFILAVLAGPVMEELIFRGALYNILRWTTAAVYDSAGVSSATSKAVSVGSAIAISALFFANAHHETSVTMFFGHVIFGVAAAHLYFKTGTIGAPILMHVLNNFLPFSIMVLAAQSGAA
ncbi:MAG: hypothetical protein C0469_00055 [Cyanobacteria bacterium DS2.3.42]|nr:hypothetical protein [Cyanobacteria bacterium DS2.3.42]